LWKFLFAPAVEIKIIACSRKCSTAASEFNLMTRMNQILLL